MKRQNLMLKSAILSLGFAFVIAGCGTDDLSDPVVTLTGDSPQVIDLGGTYTELGATATDEQDGDLTASITIDDSGVNTNVVGKYTVSYTVVDEAGNTGVAERDVWVRASNDSYAGTYEVTETYTDNSTGASDVIVYNVTITASSTDDQKILIENLGDYDPPLTVDATLSGDLNDALTVNQTVGGISFDGTGSLTQGTTTTFTFDLNYDQDGTESYSSEATFVKL